MKIIYLIFASFLTLCLTTTNVVARELTKSKVELSQSEKATYVSLNELNNAANSTNSFIHSIEFIVMLELFVSLIIFIAFIQAYKKSKQPYFSKAEKTPFVFS